MVHSCHCYGASEWTVVAKIETRFENDEPKFYFLKVIANPIHHLSHGMLTALSAQNMIKVEQCWKGNSTP